MGERRIRFERRVGKIGFLGRGVRPPRRDESDAPHSIDLRIGGAKVSRSLKDTRAATRDFADAPGLLSAVFSRTPEAVVRPESADDVAGAVGVCFEERTRVVPRGAATAGQGGVVPVRGGVVIDLTSLRNIVGLDRANRTATVEAGAVWEDVIDNLERESLSPLAYPSSACGGTVGGWVSTGGYGIGTLKHGNFRTHIESLEVALPSGFLVEASGREGRYSIPSFAGTEGQIGVVTKAVLKLRRLPERRASWVIRVPALSDGLALYNRLTRLEDLPYSLEIVSPGHPGPYGEMGGVPLLLATQEGAAADVEALAARIEEAISGTGLELDATVEARDLWRKRFSNLRERAEQGSFQSGSLLLGDDVLEGFISYLRREGAGGENLGFVCRAVERGRSLVTVGCFSGGAGEPSPLGAFALVRKAIAAGAGMGGVPYGVGIWNSPYIDVILGDRKRELRRIKREVDRLGIMNPGKFFSMTTRSGLPVPGWALGAYLGLAGRS